MLEHLSINKYSTIKSSLFPSTTSCLQHSILHSVDRMKDTFPINSLATIYYRGRNLKKMIAPSLYPRPKHTFKTIIGSCGSCDVCNNFLIYSKKFTCTVIKKKYFVKGELNCNTDNIIY